MKPLTNRQFGALGEKFAADHLKQHGYKILEKNYKNRLGELDIIAKKDGIIVFAEVKTRPVDAAVAGMYAVDKRKQFHIFRTASRYLEESGTDLQPRFDVIEVTVDRAAGKLVSVNHLEAAFSQTEPYARF